jgi:hypothetical protein
LPDVARDLCLFHNQQFITCSSAYRSVIADMNFPWA